MRNSNFFEFKNHYFLNKSSKYISSDFVCKKSNIRIHITTINDIFLVENYINDINPGECGSIYELSCEEQLIKNLLE